MRLPFDNTVWPVVIGTEREEGFEIKQVLGTAFCLWEKYFLTAGHCIERSVDPPDFVGIGSFLMETDRLVLSHFLKVNLWEDVDIALIEVEFPLGGAVPATWQFSNIGMLENVWTAGYPHALDLLDQGMMSRRAFKGYVVSSLPFRRIGEQKSHDAYELSFSAPKGLSGAPLKQQAAHDPVVGIIVANRESSLVVSVEEESSTDGINQVVHHYRKIENYGVAISSKEIGGLIAPLLGSTIKEFVRSKKLAVD